MLAPADRPPLTPNYAFADSARLDGRELAALRESVGWEGRELDRWRENIERSLAVVSVREPAGALVGVGFIAGNLWHAVLCDLTVHPEHQGRGLGRALLDERMRIITELDIWYVYTTLASSNRLRERYIRHWGFQGAGANLFLDRRAQTV